MSHPLNHIPVPKDFRRDIREHMFERLAKQALMKAQQVKSEILNDAEVDTVLHKLRTELEKRDFFNLS